MQAKTLITIFLAVCGIALVMYAGPQTIRLLSEPQSRLLQNKNNYESVDEESWKEFQIFMMKFNRTYNSIHAMQKRFNIFHQNYYWIKVQNQRNMNTRFAVNHFADLTHEEFKKNYLGYKPQLGRAKNYVDEDIEVAEEVDWIAKGAVTPVKDQAQCGSCWAFSAVGSLEGAYFQKEGKLVSFSEQELVDCSGSYGNFGCNGGLMDNAFNYWKAHGEETESDYPYTGQDGTCKQSETKSVANVKGYVDVEQNEAALKAALNGRVISVGVDAEMWSYYSSGIYDGYCSTSLDHGVTLVGYGTENGQDYWKIKNSWNTSWGESGFIRLKRTDSSSSVGQCGVAAAASYPTL